MHDRAQIFYIGGINHFCPKLGLVAVFTLLHTAAMLVLLNFVWHLRIYLGRKLK